MPEDGSTEALLKKDWRLLPKPKQMRPSGRISGRQRWAFGAGHCTGWIGRRGLWGTGSRISQNSAGSIAGASGNHRRNELFKRLYPEQAGRFKEAQAGQSASTRQIVAAQKP